MGMDLAAFRASMDQAAPPARLTPALRALWWDGKGDWDASHKAAMEAEGTAEADRVHAYLHRKEGDATNAAYWYRRAGAPLAHGPLETEWEELATLFLADSAPD
jgi:phage major head subunit gpT-like protein